MAGSHPGLPAVLSRDWTRFSSGLDPIQLGAGPGDYPAISTVFRARFAPALARALPPRATGPTPTTSETSSDRRPAPDGVGLAPLVPGHARA
jgi:hypothetical protein